MTESKLSQALLDLDAAQLAGRDDVRAQTWKVLERDRRRVWWLTALTVVLWTAAMAMVLWMLVNFALLFPEQAQLAMHVREGKVTEEVREQVQATHQITFQMITVGVAASVGVLSLAALASVVLVLASRRATLRQVNANLLEISAQLKALRQPSDGSGAGS